MKKKIVTMYFTLDYECEEDKAYDRMMHRVWNSDFNESHIGDITYLKSDSVYGEVIEATQEIIDLSVQLAKENGITITILDGDSYQDIEYDISAAKEIVYNNTVNFDWSNFTESNFVSCLNEYQDKWGRFDEIGSMKKIGNVDFKFIVSTCLTSISIRMKMYVDGKELLNTPIETYPRGSNDVLNKYKEFKEKTEGLIEYFIKYS